MKRIVIMLIACVLLITACSDESAKDNVKKNIESIRDVKVGFSQMENNGPWRIAETNSIMAAAERRDVELLYTDAKGSVDQQLKDVSYLLGQGIDYLILAPKKYDELGEALQMAKEAEVEVILIDRSCAGEPGVDYLTLIMSDHIWESERAGLLMVEATGGEARIVELTGTEGSSSATMRSTGFGHIIDEYPDIEIIVSESADFFRAEGKRVMENIIREYDDFDAVYAHNDEMAIGAIMALKSAGIEPGEDVVVISMDGERDALKAILAGDLYASIECTPYFGPIVFDKIERHIAGEEILPLYTNEDRIFTIENAEEHIDDAF